MKNGLGRHLCTPSFYLCTMTIAFSMFQAWNYSDNSVGMDFYNYWVAAMARRESPHTNFYALSNSIDVREKFYKISINQSSSNRQASAARYWQNIDKKYYEEDNERLQFFVSTPFLFSCIQLFVTGDYELDYACFRLLRLLCFLIFLFSLCFILGYSYVTIGFFSILIVTVFEPFSSDLRVGNVNLLQLGLLSLVLLFSYTYFNTIKGHLSSGFVLGLAVMFKPNVALVPICLVIGWLFHRMYRRIIYSLLGFGAGVVIAFVLSSFYFQTWRAWLWWWASAKDFSSMALVNVDEGNCALPRVLFELVGLTNTQYVVLSMAVFLFMILLCMRPKSNGQYILRTHAKLDVMFLGVGCILYHLMAPLAWLHYYLFTLPLVLYLYRPSKTNSAVYLAFRYGTCSLAFTLLSINPLAILFRNVSNMQVGVWFNIAVALLLLAALLDWLKEEWKLKVGTP